jgi:hypothetical protein
VADLGRGPEPRPALELALDRLTVAVQQEPDGAPGELLERQRCPGDGDRRAVVPTHGVERYDERIGHGGRRNS